MFFNKPKEIILYSDLPLGECKQRIKDSIDTSLGFKRFFFGSQKGEPVGKLSDNTLTIRKYIAYRNPFQTVLTAKLFAEESRTVIVCSFGINKFVQSFFSFWFTSVSLFTLYIFYSIWETSQKVQCQTFLMKREAFLFLLPVGIPSGMIIFGYLLVEFSRFLARDEDSYLLNFVKITLNSRDANK